MSRTYVHALARRGAGIGERFAVAGPLLILNADGSWAVHAPYTEGQLEALVTANAGKRRTPSRKVLADGTGEPPTVGLTADSTQPTSQPPRNDRDR